MHLLSIILISFVLYNIVDNKPIKQSKDLFQKLEECFEHIVENLENKQEDDQRS